MLESQFYSRIVMIALFGILFILSMLKKGKKNSIENPPEKHIGLKILSGVFLVLSLFSLATGILAITNIQFPDQMLEQPITANMIVRSTSAIQYWGYPTSTQNMTLTDISNVFNTLALAAYLAVFRKSGTNGMQKFLKVVGIVLMFMFFASATNLHYFDMYELFAPIGFLILAFVGLFSGNNAVVAEAANGVQAHPVVLEKESDSKYMPADAPSSDTADSTIENTDVEL